MDTIAMLRGLRQSAGALKITTAEQTYYRPLKLADALRLSVENPGATLLSGATDTALRVTKKHEVIPTIIDLGGIAELQSLDVSGDAMFVGAGVNLNRLLEASRARFPALAEMLEVFGSSQIRNVATLGGNLGTASPIGDTIPALIAHNAVVLLAGPSGSREVALDSFVKGYRKTERAADEIITGVRIPLMSGDASVKFYKVSKRRDLDISTVSAGFRVSLDGDRKVREIKLAFGGMAAMVRRATGAEDFLRGKLWERGSIEHAMELVRAEFSPISDARSGAAARTVASGNLLLKFWHETAGGGNP
jgi:xanthine dehydrogenase iron-sulfur cluster and FAD-binding subunit A